MQDIQQEILDNGPSLPLLFATVIDKAGVIFQSTECLTIPALVLEENPLGDSKELSIHQMPRCGRFPGLRLVGFDCGSS